MLGSSIARTDLFFFWKVETTVLVVETPDPVVNGGGSYT